MSSPEKMNQGQRGQKEPDSPVSDQPDDNKIIPRTQSDPCMRNGLPQSESTPIHLPGWMEEGITVFGEVSGIILLGLWSLASSIVRLLMMILKVVWAVLVIALAIDFLSDL